MNLDWISIASLIFGVLGVLLALYQGSQKKKLSNFVRSQSWFIYSLANTATAHVQASLRLYKENHKSNADLTVLETLAKSDAFSQSVFHQTVRQIQLSEPKFDHEQIYLWVGLGKVTKEHAPIFYKLMPTDGPSWLVVFWHTYITRKIKQEPQQQKPEIQPTEKIT